MSQNSPRPHNYNPKEATVTVGQIIDYRDRRNENQAILAAELNRFTDIDQAYVRLEEQVAWNLKDCDQHNYIRILANTWDEQRQGHLTNHKPLSVKLVGYRYTPEGAATALLPQPIEVAKVALLCGDRLNYRSRNLIADYLQTCLEELSRDANGGQLTFDDDDCVNAILFLALAEQLLARTRSRYSYDDVVTQAWMDAFMDFVASTSTAPGYTYMICSSLLHLLGSYASSREPEFSLRVKMIVTHYLLGAVISDSDLRALCLDPHTRFVITPWLDLYVQCWHSLPQETQRRLLMDYGIETQFTLLDFVALAVQRQSAHICSVQYFSTELHTTE